VHCRIKHASVEASRVVEGELFLVMRGWQMRCRCGVARFFFSVPLFHFDRPSAVVVIGLPRSVKSYRYWNKGTSPL